MANSKYKNVLVPYDDSKYSQKALEVARMLTCRFGSNLHIATIVDISNVPPPGLIRSKDRQILAEITAKIKNSVKENIQKKADKLAGEKIRTRTWVVEGTAADEILKLIKQNSIDLVVMGSVGLSGISRIRALGSVSRRVSEMADCPVIIVH